MAAKDSKEKGHELKVKGEPDHETEPDYQTEDVKDEKEPGSNVNDNDNDEKNEEDTKKEKIKILFLDIDGVMNGSKDLWDDDQTEDPKNKALFAVERINRLKAILEKTKCKIVLSTAWRRSEAGKESIKKEFIQNGIPWDDIYIGDTPILDYYFTDVNEDIPQRTIEIDKYLESIMMKYIVEQWCAVDDMILNSGEKAKKIIDGHFVQTDGYHGMTDEDTLKIIKILNCEAK